MDPRKATASVNYNGKNIDTKLAEYLRSFSFVDVASGESDSVSLVINDKDRKWIKAWFPSKGDTLSASVTMKNWSSEGDAKKLPCGSFVIDDFSFSGTPIQLKLEAIAIPAKSGFKRTQRTKTYEKTTLQNIGKEVAKRAGVKFYYEAPKISIEKVEQSEKDDCSFLNELVKLYGLAMKIYKNKIVIFNEAIYEKKKAVATLTEENIEPNDYTKREDGTPSDVSNTAYAGGAFAWIPKIYKFEQTIGNDRIVKFSTTKREGFEPVGFIDPDNKELEGVWIPMFYGAVLGADTSTPKMTSLAGTQPGYSRNTSQEKTAIDNFGARAKFFGGAIVQTLTDLLIMWGKSTNSQAVYGNGNCSGYDSSLAPTNGVKQNAVVGGGQFYGTSDSKSLNKILHSIVLGSYQQWQRDPYTVMVNGRIKVSKNYDYDLTGAKYTDTGVTLPKITKSDSTQNVGVFYPHKYQTVPGFGHVPTYPYKGSTSTGGCDGLWQNVEITAVALRFGTCDCGLDDGLRCVFLYNAATIADWYVGASILLLPPVSVAA